jgi:hypothetical protein
MRACSGFLQHKNAFLKPIPLIFQHTIFTVIVCIVCSDLCRGSSSGSSSGSSTFAVAALVLLLEYCLQAQSKCTFQMNVGRFSNTPATQ